MNKIRCLNCNTILESKFRHDFQRCSCENHTFCDGGNEYQRLGGVHFSLIEVWDNKLNKFIRLSEETDALMKIVERNEIFTTENN